MLILISNILGFLLDLCLGDPIWMPHPVVCIGKCISKAEPFIRRMFPETPAGERNAGMMMAILIPVSSMGISAGILLIAYHINFHFWFLLQTFWAYQILATRCLAQESRKVHRLLYDVNKARKQIARLVGRDTQHLTKEEIIKACVETVAENTSDGVTAPLFYLMLGGVPLGFFYKAINTLDSMIGYRNEKYQYFGWASAKLDDIVNFLPSRICALLMILSAFLANYDGKQAFHIFLRDRNKHLSPNAAQTESVAAGALGMQLGGAHSYFGEIVDKPTIGDDNRPAQADDILKINQMLYITAMLSVILFGILRYFLV